MPVLSPRPGRAGCPWRQVAAAAAWARGTPVPCGGRWTRLTEQPKFPTDRELKAFEITTEAIDGWEKFFERKRRRLVRFLRTAAKLEEDLVWGIF